jgi:hypothetical protein
MSQPLREKRAVWLVHHSKMNEISTMRSIRPVSAACTDGQARIGDVDELLGAADGGGAGR